MATIGGKSLGEIQSEGQAKNSGLFTQPLPVSDSDSTILLDLFGTTRTITIDGVFQHNTKANLVAFVTDIEGLQNGSQTGLTYVGDFITTNKTVLIQDFNWTWSAGSVNRINYSLTLIEGLA